MKISSLLSYIEPGVKSYSINHTLSRTTIHNQNTYTKTIYLKSQTNPGLCITFFSTINNLKKKKTSKNPNFMNNFSSIFFYVKTEVRSQSINCTIWAERPSTIGEINEANPESNNNVFQITNKQTRWQISQLFQNKRNSEEPYQSIKQEIFQTLDNNRQTSREKSRARCFDSSV